MIRKKNNILLISLLLTLPFILILVRVVKQSNDNNLLKDAHGSIIQSSLLHVLDVISDAKRDLNDSDFSNLTRYSWQFNEFSMLAEPPKGFWLYYVSLRNDYQELIRLEESNSSSQEIDKIKEVMELKLTRLEQVILLIRKDCGDDNIKYYSLVTEDNKTMKKAIEILSPKDGINSNSN